MFYFGDEDCGGLCIIYKWFFVSCYIALLYYVLVIWIPKRFSTMQANVSANVEIIKKAINHLQSQKEMFSQIVEINPKIKKAILSQFTEMIDHYTQLSNESADYHVGKNIMLFPIIFLRLWYLEIKVKLIERDMEYFKEFISIAQKDIISKKK